MKRKRTLGKRIRMRLGEHGKLDSAGFGFSECAERPGWRWEHSKSETGCISSDRLDVFEF